MRSTPSAEHARWHMPPEHSLPCAQVSTVVPNEPSALQVTTSLPLHALTPGVHARQPSVGSQIAAQSSEVSHELSTQVWNWLPTHWVCPVVHGPPSSSSSAEPDGPQATSDRARNEASQSERAMAGGV